MKKRARAARKAALALRVKPAAAQPVRAATAPAVGRRPAAAVATKLPSSTSPSKRLPLRSASSTMVHAGHSKPAASGAAATPSVKKKHLKRKHKEGSAAVAGTHTASEPTARPNKLERAAALRQSNSARRLERFGASYKPNAAGLGGLSLLEKLKITDGVRSDYQRRVQAFESWRQEQEIPAPTTAGELLALTLDYLDVQFLEGAPHGDGDKLVAAIQHALPSVLSEPDWKARVSHALRGWEKRGPTESQAPPPEELVMAAAGAALSMKEVLAGTSYLLQYLCCARPGEIDHLKVGDVVAPVASAGRSWGVLIAPTAGLSPAKTGERDESVLLDNRGFEWVGETVLRPLVRQRPAEAPLLPIEAEKLAAV